MESLIPTAQMQMLYLNLDNERKVKVQDTRHSYDNIHSSADKEATKINLKGGSSSGSLPSLPTYQTDGFIDDNDDNNANDDDGDELLTRT